MKIESVINKDGSITKTIDGKFWIYIPLSEVLAYKELNKKLNKEFEKHILWGKGK